MKIYLLTPYKSYRLEVNVEPSDESAIRLFGVTDEGKDVTFRSIDMYQSLRDAIEAARGCLDDLGQPVKTKQTVEVRIHGYVDDSTSPLSGKSGGLAFGTAYLVHMLARTGILKIDNNLHVGCSGEVINQDTFVGVEGAERKLTTFHKLEVQGKKRVLFVPKEDRKSRQAVKYAKNKLNVPTSFENVVNLLGRKSRGKRSRSVSMMALTVLFLAFGATAYYMTAPYFETPDDVSEDQISEIIAAPPGEDKRSEQKERLQIPPNVNRHICEEGFENQLCSRSFGRAVVSVGSNLGLESLLDRIGDKQVCESTRDARTKGLWYLENQISTYLLTTGRFDQVYPKRSCNENRALGPEDTLITIDLAKIGTSLEFDTKVRVSGQREPARVGQHHCGKNRCGLRDVRSVANRIALGFRYEFPAVARLARINPQSGNLEFEEGALKWFQDRSRGVIFDTSEATTAVGEVSLTRQRPKIIGTHLEVYTDVSDQAMALACLAGQADPEDCAGLEYCAEDEWLPGCDALNLYVAEHVEMQETKVQFAETRMVTVQEFADYLNSGFLLQAKSCDGKPGKTWNDYLPDAPVRCISHRDAVSYASYQNRTLYRTVSNHNTEFGYWLEHCNANASCDYVTVDGAKGVRFRDLGFSDVGILLK